MVSSTEGKLLDQLLDKDQFDEARKKRLQARFTPMLEFRPMDGIERAIFIAAPHRGTHVAGTGLGRLLAGVVKLPLAVLERFAELTADIASDSRSRSGQGPIALPNSIENLREDDPFIQAASRLPISPQVRYHSIIARKNAEGPLVQTDDGLVPYPSAHLAGAVSEKVIVSDHSVQETAASILELRRILHLDLAEDR